MVGTPDAPLDAPLAVHDQAGAAVTADVEEGPRAAVLAADHDHAVAADLAHQEAPGLARPDETCPTQIQPAQKISSSSQSRTAGSTKAAGGSIVACSTGRSVSET